jgi:hypothetical protein
VSLLEELKAENPELAKFSDEDLLKAAHKVMGGDIKDVADQLGYSTPSSMLGKELYAGGNQYLAGFGHIGSAMGIPGAAEYTRRKQERAEALQALSTAPHSWEEMKFGDPEKGFLPYLGQLGAGSAPVMAEAAGLTLADIATGGALTPAVGPRIAARVGPYLPEFLGGQALKAGSSFAERRAAIEGAREAAPGLARTGMLPVYTYPSSLGDVLGNQQEEAGRYDLPSGLGAAALYSPLNILGMEGAITRGALPRLGLKSLEKSFLGRAGSAALASGTSEAAGETGQEVANQLGRMGVNRNATLFSPDALERYKESAIGGGLLGAIPGGAAGGFHRKPLDKRVPTNLLDRPADDYASMVETSLGLTPGSATPYTPEQQAAATAASAARTQDAAAKDYWERMYPSAPPQYGTDYAAQFEASQGLPPGWAAAPGGAAAAAPKPKAAANAARDAGAVTIDPVAEQVRAVKTELKPHLVAAHPGETLSDAQIHRKITTWAGNPQTMDEAAANVEAKIVARLTRGTGKGSEAERHKAVEPMILFYNAIRGLPESQQKTVEQWQADVDAAAEAAKQAAAAAKVKVGDEGKQPGAVTTLPPKPTTPEQVPAYKKAMAPILTAGVAAEDLQGLMLTRGKEAVTGEEGLQISMPSPEVVAKLEKTPEGRKQLAALADKLATAAELGTGEEAKKGSLRGVAEKLGITHSTLQGMVNRALKKVKENAAAAGISEDDAHEILGLQSSYDVIDSGVRGTGAGGTYEGGERVSVDERPEGVADVRGEKAAEVTTEEAPAAEEGEAPAAEEGEAAPVAARGEDVVEAAEVEGAAVGWTDKLRKNAEDAMEEWTEGRADDDPTWDQLADIHQLQWVKGYVDSYAQSRAAKPKEQGAVFYRELGERRKAVMRGVKEHGLRQPDSEAAAREDDTGGAGEGGREMGGVSEKVSATDEKTVPPATAGKPKGEAGAKPAVAGKAGKVTEAAPTVEKKEPKTPATTPEEEQALETSADRAQRKWDEAVAVESNLGSWDELSPKAQEEFSNAAEKDQRLIDAVNLKTKDMGYGRLSPEATAIIKEEDENAPPTGGANLASAIRATPGVDMTRMAKLLGPQLYGNLNDIGEVTIKELFQNSFDALKGAIEKGQRKDGHIQIVLDDKARTITLIDDGTGMTPDTINNAFLTLAGTMKETERASGGLGIAKMLFLFGNESLKLRTIRNGLESTLETSGTQLMQAFSDPSKAPDIQTRPTKEPSGTTVTVKIPKTFHNEETDADEDLKFPGKYTALAILEDSPLFENVSVRLNDEDVAIGDKFPADQYTVLTTAKFSWGKVRVLVAPNEYPGHNNVTMLSNGLMQFKAKIAKDPTDMWSGPAPYKFFFNIEPSVKADAPNYPIALNRKGLSASAKSDFEALMNYLGVMYANTASEAASQSFGMLSQFSEDGKTVKHIDLKVPAGKTGTTLRISKDDKVEIRDGRMYVNNRAMPEMTKEQMKKMQHDPAQFRVDQKLLDADALLVHDNVLLDDKPYLEEARKALGDEAVDAYLLGFARVLKNLRDAARNIGGKKYADINTVPVGVSVDTDYYGVNTMIPFKSMMLNPTVFKTNVMDDVADLAVGTMIHELAHHAERNHSETGFIPELQRMFVLMSQSGDMAKAIADLKRVIQDNAQVYNYFKGVKSGTLKNRGIRLAGGAQWIEGRSPAERAAAARKAGRDGGERAKVRAGTGTGGEDRVAGEGREGPSAPDEGGIARSEASLRGTGRTRKTATTAAHMRSTLKKLFFSDSRFDQRVNIVQSVSDLDPELVKEMKIGPNDQGFADAKGNVTLIADNIDKGSELGVFLHEMGVHVGMEGLVGKDNMLSLAQQVVNWSDKNDGSLESIIAKRVVDRVNFAAESAEKRGEPFTDTNFIQEAIAYFVEEAVAHGINPMAMDAKTELGRWFRKLWAAAKVALRKMGLDRFDQLSAQDVVNLAHGAARLELEGTWHGTAAAFRRFNHAYMGTGEGAQAFGWGTYLAQRPGIAHAYWESDVRRKGGGDFDLTYDGERVDQWAQDPVDYAKFALAREAAGLSFSAKDDLELGLKSYESEPEGDHYKFYEDALAALDKLDIEKTGTLRDETKPKGSLMRVDVGIGEHEWLDLDLPFNEQSKHVQDALNKVMPETTPREGQVVDAYAKLIAGVHDRAVAKRIMDVVLDWEVKQSQGEKALRIQDMMKKALPARDFEVYSHLRERVIAKLFTGIQPDATGSEIYSMLVNKFGSRKAASEALDKAGVKGNKFLDQPSRGARKVNYTGPADAHIPIIQHNMEGGMTFAEAKEHALGYSRRDMAHYPKGSGGYKSAQFSFNRVNKAQEQHYQFEKDQRTRNFVVFNEKNIHRAVTQVGAKRSDLQFSVRAPAQAAATKHLDNVQEFAQRHGLGFMITEDIADLATRVGLPEVRAYVDVAKTREGERVRFEQPVGKIVEQYDALPQHERGTEAGSVNRFIHDATMKGDLTGIGRFSAAGQKLIRDVFQHGKDTLALKKKLIEEEVGREYDVRIAQETDDAVKDELRREKKALLNRYSKLMTVKNSDTYAPLKRFGDYIVSAKSAEYVTNEAAKTDASKKWIADNEGDPAHYQVHFTESQGEANALAESLRPQFAGGKLYAAARDADIRNHHDLFRAFPVLLTRLNNEYPMQGGKVSPMTRIIRDLYLQALAENHARKVEMRRRSITGASNDMMRAFVTQGRADASFMSNLKHNDALQDALQGMRDGAERDRNKLQPYVNEMLQRHAASYETQSADWANKIKRTTSIWLLATNPTYYLQQLVQPGSMSLPVLAGFHGYWRSVRALRRGYSDMMPLIKGTDLTGHIDWNTAPADVRDMLTLLANNGAIDVTNTMDQGEWETAGKSKAGAVWNRIDRKLRGLNTRVEALNRSVTAVAAYRAMLATNGGDKVAAARHAEAMVRQTHGSYDGSNTPRYLQGTYKGLLTQFRRFQIIQISMIFRLGYNAFKGASAGERAIARRALTYTLLHTAAIGGVLGMPGAAAITALVARLFGPDDEPPDFEKWAREAIGDQVISDLLLNGVPAMLGMNASQKFGMGNMLSINAFADFPHDRKSFEKYVFGSLGPSVGLGAKAVDGTALIYSGDVARGAEQLLPSGFANAMKGYRIGTEGVALRKGDTVLAPEELGFVDALMQGLGMPTTPITRQQKLSQTKYTFDTYYHDRTAELIHDYQQARKSGEPTGDVIAEWNQMQEGRVRNGYTRQPLSLLLKSAQQQMKRERGTAGGVEFTKANRRFVQEQANL